MKRQLIVNADDFGRTPGVTAGILRAHREGVVTSTTAMMNLPYAQEALRQARECPQLGVGVHLNFTFDKPLLPLGQVSTLVDESGYFNGPEVQIWRAEEVDPAQLYAEWMAQVEAFRRIGREPDHLDCHHPAHIHPRFFTVYLQVAEECDLPIRMPMPPRDAADMTRPPAVLGEELPPDLIQGIVTQDLKLLSKRSVHYPDHFLGDFYGEKQLTAQWLLEAFPKVAAGVSELMTHPGLADAELLARSSYAREREQEVALLCDLRVRAALCELGIELVTFGVLNVQHIGE